MTQLSRTHIRVQRSDGREWPNITIAMRELLGTAQEISPSESQRIRLKLRTDGLGVDRHGFTWKSVGGTVAEVSIGWADFTFGVELEVLAPFARETMAAELNAIGASNWNVVHDGSLAAQPGYSAMEVVSPVLQGEAGLAQLRVVMDRMKARGCKVNSSCGMHVHVGVRGMKVSRLTRIARAFLANERHFDALVPAARLNNRYCQSNAARAYSPDRVLSCTTVGGIAQQMNGGNSPQHYNPYRYHKLNFQSFVRHGTIEFRQHGGTVEPDKAAAWVRLITGFCAQHAANATPGAAVSFDQFVEGAVVGDQSTVSFLEARRAKFAAQRAA